MRRLFRIALYLGIALQVAWLVLQQWNVVGMIGHGLSPIADPYSESNAIRAAESYVDNGFTANYGLPDICYGMRFYEFGWKGQVYFEQGALIDHYIYPGYPPGPDLILGFMMKLFGKEPLGFLRLLPLAVAAACLSLLAVALCLGLGPAWALAVLFALARSPMLSNMMHGLHYQGYAMSLLLLQSAILIVHLFGRLSFGVTAALSLLLGFVQGWLSFDYFFLVSLCALPFGLYGAPRRTRLRQAVCLCALSALGFASAHALHLVQIALFSGGFEQGLEVLLVRGANRLAGDDEGPGIGMLFFVLENYFTAVLPSPLYFHTSFVAILVAAFLACFPRLGGSRFVLGVDRDAARFAGALALALLASCGWISVMWQHALVHVHFLGRHFIFFYLLALFGTALRLSGREPKPHSP